MLLIVLPLLVGIKDYLGEFGDRSPGMEIFCPRCGRRLRRHGRYFRMMVLGKALYRIPIYRRFCPRCKRTFGLCPHFLRPQSQFALGVREASMRLLLQQKSPASIAESICQGPKAGGISERTILRWQKRWNDGAADWLSHLSARILVLSQGTDLTPYFAPKRMPRGRLQTLCSLGQLCRNMVWGPNRPSLFSFFRLAWPSWAI